jgi:hypothetical protein
MYSNWYILCILCWLAARTPTLLAATQHKTHTRYTNCCTNSTSWWWANKYSKYVQAINHNKLKANSASWSTVLIYCDARSTERYDYLQCLSPLYAQQRSYVLDFVCRMWVLCVLSGTKQLCLYSFMCAVWYQTDCVCTVLCVLSGTKLIVSVQFYVCCRVPNDCVCTVLCVLSGTKLIVSVRFVTFTEMLFQ